jgi:hypothetical protein
MEVSSQKRDKRQRERERKKERRRAGEAACRCSFVRYMHKRGGGERDDLEER